jgi:phosphatidate cytidylyltransferase
VGRHSSDDDGDDSGHLDDAARVSQATLIPSGPVGPDVAADPSGAPEASAPSSALAKSSRAGRNLPAAIAVGVGLGAVIIASLLVYRPSFVVIIIIAVLIGVYELVSAVPARPPVIPLLAGAIAMEVVAWFRGSGGLVVGLLITVGGVMVWRLGDGAAGYGRDVSASVLVTLYVPLLAGFAVLLAHPSDGAGRVLAFVGTVVCSDTGGYATGVLLGKHPMAPRISKAKTWEGFAGSLLACAIAGALLVQFTFHDDWWKGIAFGLAIAVTATLGDLGESMIKRDIGIKDMGNLLPGHGGIMDRLDSLLPCAAVAYLLLSWISPS